MPGLRAERDPQDMSIQLRAAPEGTALVVCAAW